MRRQREHHDHDHDNDDADADDDDNVPLHHRRPFGAGLKRNKIEFVRAADLDQGIVGTASRPSASADIGDLYASIVLSNDKKAASAPATTAPSPRDDTTPELVICPVCNVPVSTTLQEHEATLAHQVKVPHSHPPSALDRSRMGLRALKSQGWDPDARVGLGREGEGVRFPIKLKKKDDTLGIGAQKHQETKREQPKEEPPRKLTSKELKAAAIKDRQRSERLQREIYGRVDVEEYLRREMPDEV